MIAIAPQMRILVAVEPADLRNYAESPVMLSLEQGSHAKRCHGYRSHQHSTDPLSITVFFQMPLS
jgi:hypothetical protein